MARPGGRGGAPGNSQRTTHPTWRFRTLLWTAAGTPRVRPLRSPSGGPSSRRLGEGRPGTRRMEEQAMGGADGGVVVTGVTGGLGGRVARRLAERGVRQRLGTRDPARAPGLAGGEGVTGSYGAGPECTFTFGRDHWHAEEHIKGGGLRHTFLRDNLYIDFLPLLAGPDGVIRGPAGDGRLAAVARDDIADVAVAVLLDEGGRHDGRTYDMTGPEALSLDEVAEELSRASGRTITYQAETLEEAYASRASYGAPDWVVAGWVTTYVAIANGDLEEVSDDVAAVAGHPPISLAEFLRGNPDSHRRLVEGP